MKHLIYFFTGIGLVLLILLQCAAFLALLYLAATHFVITIFIGVSLRMAYLLYELGKAFY